MGRASRVSGAGFGRLSPLPSWERMPKGQVRGQPSLRLKDSFDAAAEIAFGGFEPPSGKPLTRPFRPPSPTKGEEI